MRLIMILRHAKAERGHGKPDHRRTLTGVGRTDARQIGQAMKENSLIPDVILSSDSARTMETATEMLAGLGVSVPVIALRELYQCEPDEYPGLIRAHAEGAARPLVVGHNPTVEEFVSAASDREVPMKTCDLAVFTVTDGKGGEAGAAGLRLDRILRPERRE